MSRRRKAAHGGQSRAKKRPPRSRAQRLEIGVFLLALTLAMVGGGLLVRRALRVPVEEATIDGLYLQLDQARWVLDQMDHGENFQKPSTMMPGMPAWGEQRVTLELTLENRSSVVQTFNGGEFQLVPRYGDAVGPVGANVGWAQLLPGQTFNTSIHFDFDTSAPFGQLHGEWRRAGRTVILPIPEPAEHYHLRPHGGEVALPQRARLVMPLGDAERGALLFGGRYGCVACHGDPQVAGSNLIGPDLGNIGRSGATRIAGLPAEQYIYNSILRPDEFIAPECRAGQPCEEPTAMPEYASLVTVQDLADLLVYLMDQRRSS